jgi:hypothetical protein
MTRITGCCLLGLALLGAPSRGQDRAPAAQKADARKSDEFVFEVEPKSIVAGEAATLHWSIKGATKVLLEEATGLSGQLKKVGTFGGSGSLQIWPKENTTYVVTCEGSATYSCASVTVRVQVKPR